MGEVQVEQDLVQDSEVIPDIGDAEEEASEELETLYGFDFEEIAVRNDDRFDSPTGRLVKERLQRKEHYKTLGRMGEHTMRASLLGATVSATAGEIALAGLSSAVAFAGYLGGIAAVDIGQSIEQIHLQEYGIVEDEEAVLDFLDSQDHVKAEGPLPYTLASGEEAATDFEDILESSNESMLFYTQEDSGTENRFKLVCYTNNYPDSDGEKVEPEEYVFSGYTDEGLDTSDKHIRDDFEGIREFLGVEEGPDPEENQLVKPL